jgi:D-alanyl-lipoteichoic acid acyltransferase DltB (MBOAT superfamily)
MIFTTPQFVLFVIIFLAIYAQLDGRSRKIFLLIASYLFYASWNAKFLILIVGSSLLDFYVGAAMARSDDARRRRRLLLLSLVGNLGALSFFKYFNFFVESALALLNAAGLRADPATLEIVLPVGISFYTFQTLTYSIDIYRRKLQPTDSLLDFCLYVAFFPQLVAGPIERAGHLLPQLAYAVRRPIPGGWTLVAIGVFKKVVIADNMAALVALTYASPEQSYPLALWVGTYAFAIQIYCDFSGYSDIAVGLARLMGIDLVQNFRSPYAADGPSDFWRRWHISLSSWLRDYLYIPLGGNRGSRIATLRNLALTMLLGGLWHGAAWNFALWGLFHGLLLILLRPVSVAKVRALAAYGASSAVALPLALARRLVFFHLVCLGWALFRAESLADCWTIWVRMLDPRGWQWSDWQAHVQSSGEGPYVAFMMACAAGLVIAQNLFRDDSKALADRIGRLPRFLVALVICALLVASTLLAPEQAPPFIYFQF